MLGWARWGSKYRCVVKIGFQKKYVYLETVSGEGSCNNNNNNNNNGRRQGGVRKEEIQQWRTITLMRTVKKTHNIKLREKC